MLMSFQKWNGIGNITAAQWYTVNFTSWNLTLYTANKKVWRLPVITPSYVKLVWPSLWFYQYMWSLFNFHTMWSDIKRVRSFKKITSWICGFVSYVSVLVSVHNYTEYSTRMGKVTFIQQLSDFLNVMR